MNNGLVVVDMLEEFTNGRLGSEKSREIIPNVCRLVRHAQGEGWPVAFACDSHLADDPEILVWGPHAMADDDGSALNDEVHAAADFRKANVRTFSKSAYDAFRDTTLGEWLRLRNVNDLVICGTATHICVAQTAIGAMYEGFRPIIVPDAVAGFPDTDEALWLDHIATVTGATLAPTDNIASRAGLGVPGLHSV